MSSLVVLGATAAFASAIASKVFGFRSCFTSRTTTNGASARAKMGDREKGKDGEESDNSVDAASRIAALQSQLQQAEAQLQQAEAAKAAKEEQMRKLQTSFREELDLTQQKLAAEQEARRLAAQATSKEKLQADAQPSSDPREAKLQQALEGSTAAQGSIEGKNELQELKMQTQKLKIENTLLRREVSMFREGSDGQGAVPDELWRPGGDPPRNGDPPAAVPQLPAAPRVELLSRRSAPPRDHSVDSVDSSIANDTGSSHIVGLITPSKQTCLGDHFGGVRIRATAARVVPPEEEMRSSTTALLSQSASASASASFSGSQLVAQRSETSLLEEAHRNSAFPPRHGGMDEHVGTAAVSMRRPKAASRVTSGPRAATASRSGSSKQLLPSGGVAAAPNLSSASKLRAPGLTQPQPFGSRPHGHGEGGREFSSLSEGFRENSAPTVYSLQRSPVQGFRECSAPAELAGLQQIRYQQVWNQQAPLRQMPSQTAGVPLAPSSDWALFNLLQVPPGAWASARDRI